MAKDATGGEQTPFIAHTVPLWSIVMMALATAGGNTREVELAGSFQLAGRDRYDAVGPSENGEDADPHAFARVMVARQPALVGSAG